MVYSGHISEVEMNEVNFEGAKGAYIQWLITKPEAKNYAMRRFVIKPGGVIPTHSHDWEHEIYILEGKGVVKVGSKEINVKKDTFLYIEPNIPHSYFNNGVSDLVFICIIPMKGVKS